MSLHWWVVAAWAALGIVLTVGLVLALLWLRKQRRGPPRARGEDLDRLAANAGFERKSGESDGELRERMRAAWSFPPLMLPKSKRSVDNCPVWMDPDEWMNPPVDPPPSSGDVVDED